jgi:hypothetical protein
VGRVLVKPKDRRSNLVRAAALILAEIERLDRSPSTSRAILRAAAEIWGRLRENDIRQPPANDTAAQVNCEATA